MLLIIRFKDLSDYFCNCLNKHLLFTKQSNSEVNIYGLDNLRVTVQIESVKADGIILLFSEEVNFAKLLEKTAFNDISNLSDIVYELGNCKFQIIFSKIEELKPLFKRIILESIDIRGDGLYLSMGLSAK